MVISSLVTRKTTKSWFTFFSQKIFWFTLYMVFQLTLYMPFQFIVHVSKGAPLVLVDVEIGKI